MPDVLVGELAKRVGRTTETIKRWADEGLLACDRDERYRRVFNDDQVERCREIMRLSVTAQLTNRKLADLLDELPEQLGLLALEAS